ncbi:energy-coupled thiamine transporter ThiT [Spiroplasma chrysopicola]|uniref:Thiamine transporter n=1 Tax=Spiroplasma chrysopicola DF-1 TaxID=1276227 RepID=R4UG27_9MOLU|nr:energy-coupled thiamine transporter ThiT [Spiroplasma chrysopicola]AGM25095.1 hypothetical protein SCHRY_v1c05170 [Spiroplasma chrysopicola DF-1]
MTITKETQWKKILIANKSLVFISLGLFLSFFIIFVAFNYEQLITIFPSLTLETVGNLKKFLIAFTTLGLIFNVLYTISSWLCTKDEYLNYKMQFVMLNIIGLNLINLSFNCVIYLRYRSEIKWEITNQSFWKHLQIKLGFWKWQTFDYVLIALFASFTIALGYVESYFLPNLPFGGGLALKYIPLIIIAFLHSSLAGWITGAISALMSLLFIQAGYIISPWSYLLDYFLPMTTPALAGVMRFAVKKDKNYITYVNYFILCITIFLIIYLWQVIGGYFIWTTAFPDSVWPGYSNWLYSLIYNFIHLFIFSYPISQVVIPLSLRALAPVFWERYLKTL